MSPFLELLEPRVVDQQAVVDVKEELQAKLVQEVDLHRYIVR